MKITVRIYALCENTVYYKHEMVDNSLMGFDDSLSDTQADQVKKAVSTKINKLLHPSFWSVPDRILVKDLVGMYIEVKI